MTTFIKLSYRKKFNWLIGIFFIFPVKQGKASCDTRVIFINRWISRERQSRYFGNFVGSSLTRYSILPSQTPQLLNREFEGRIGMTCFGRRSRKSAETKLAPSSLSKFHEGYLNLSVLYVPCRIFHSRDMYQFPFFNSRYQRFTRKRDEIENHITI